MLPVIRGIRGFVSPIRDMHLASRFVLPSVKNSKVMTVFSRGMFTTTRTSSERVSTMITRSGFAKRFFAEATEEAPKSSVPMVVSVVRTTKKATKTALYLAIACGVIACGYVTVLYMWPSPISPQRMFTDAFNVVKLNDKINQLLGGNLKAYGVDLNSGAKDVVGRRNMIQNISFVGKDGILRCRIVFNVEGKNGKGLVYAEKSKEMGKGEFFYLIFVQPETNKIIPIYDNREYIEREKLQEEVVKQLKEHKASMYGHRSYDITFQQLNEFGKYAKDINVIDCAVKTELCSQLQIAMIPSWSIDGVRYRGFIHLEDFDTVLNPPKEKPSPMESIKNYFSSMKNTIMGRKGDTA